MKDLPPGPPGQDPPSEPREIVSIDPQIEVLPSLPEIPPSSENPVFIYLGRLGSDRSRKTQYYLLRVAVSVFRNIHLSETHGLPEKFPWHQLQYAHMQMLQGALRTRLHKDGDKLLASNSVNRCVAAVRRVLLMCKRLGHINGNEYMNISDIDPVHGSRVAKGRMLETEELVTLCQGARAEVPIGARDTAIVLLMAKTGLRLAEVASLRLEDYSDGNIRTIGKGNKEREVPVAEVLKVYLEEWLKIRGKQPGPLFYRSRRKGKELLIGEGITDDGIYKMIKTLANRMSLDVTSPHDLRRTFISQLLGEGIDLKTVSELAGHSDVNTTARYDRRGIEVRKKAVNTISEDPDIYRKK